MALSTAGDDAHAQQQTEDFPLDAVLALMRWQQTRRGYDGDAALIATGLALLAPDERGEYGAQSLLARAEAALNVTWRRMAAEVMQFAVFLVTKAKRDDEARPEQTKHALRLLQLALAAFASTQGERSASPVSLSTNSCNLLLAALAEALETAGGGSDGLCTLQDAKYIFVHLFGLPHDASDAAATPSFQLYRPPTNVFADFMDRALSTCFERVDALTAALSDEDVAGHDAAQLARHVEEHVALTGAVVTVFQEMQKTQMNKRKVFLAVAKTSLRAILRFRHCIDKWTANTHVDGAAPILKRLDQTIEDALFDAEHIREFDNALVLQRSVWARDSPDADEHADGTEESKRAGGKAKKRRNNDRSPAKQSALISYQKQLFDELRSILVDTALPLELRAFGVGEFMRVLMRGFSARIRAAATSKIVDAKADPKTSRKRAAIVIAATSTTYSPFKFWAELCAVAFQAYEQTGAQAEGASIVVVLYHSLFKSLCDYDVYRVTEDTEEREQFTTMEKVLSSFFARLPSDISNVLEAGNAIEVQHGSDLRCQIVSRAVECSPNLVDCCCTAILEMLGAQTQLRTRESATAARVGAESQAVVDLVQAYDSMRLLEKFLLATFAVRSENTREASGLYALLSQPACEARLRKAFVALPPGQVEVLWTLFADQVVGFSGGSTGASGGSLARTAELGVVRLVFQMFMQEIHVTPQNRAKIVALVTKTLEDVVDPVADSIAGSSDDVLLSTYDREVCSIFGELLMFYHAAKAASTTASALISHFEAVFDKLGGSGDRFVPVMEALLLSSQLHERQNRKKPKKHSRKLKTTARDDGLGRAGIIKICVHWLQKTKTAGEGARPAQGERITTLVIDYVVQTRCWDAVAFYLPELMAHATTSGARALLDALVGDYIATAAGASSNLAPERILFDAAFYEIVGIRRVAATALASVAKQHIASIRSVKPSAAGHSVQHVARAVEAFFSFLASVPEGYFPLSDCGDLLAQVLDMYEQLEGISTSDTRRRVLDGARAQGLAWLQMYFRPIAAAAFRDEIPEAIQARMRFVFEHDAVEAMDPHVTAEMLRFALSHKSSAADGARDDSFAGSLLRSSMALTNKTKRARRAVAITHAIAIAHRDDPSLGKSHAETEAMSTAMALLRTILDGQSDVDGSHISLVLDLLSALVTRHAAVSATTGRKREHSDAESNEPFTSERRALLAHIGPALTSSMKAVSTPSQPDSLRIANSSAWRFFATCCTEYALVRSAMVDELKGFGFLLAAALSALGTWAVKHQAALVSGNCDFDEALAPLRNLVRAANKLEFRLLLATVRKEVSAPEVPRKLAALAVLCEVVTGGGDEKKLSATRRQSVSECKDAMLAVLVQNVGELLFALQGSAVEQETTRALAAEAAVWNVRALALLFCKPELFTWKAPELTQAFVAFELLYASASPLSPTDRQVLSLEQLHRVWTHSYTLLLRIVRHHFASLVNCIPHLVQASNALLQVLLNVSNDSSEPTLRPEASAQWPLLVEWSSNLARLFGYMKEHDAQLRKHVVYLLMPFLVAATRGQLPVGLQQKLRPGVFALLDMCSPFEKEQLYAALDASGKSLLKTLDTSYKLTHRYVGKV